MPECVSVEGCMMSYATILPLIAAPAAVGLWVWRRRGNPGAATLAVLIWSLALWGVAHALGVGAQNSLSASILHLAGRASQLVAAFLWFLFALRYTGQDRRLTRTRVVLTSVLPLAILTVIAGEHVLQRVFGDPVGLSALTYGNSSWLTPACGALFLILGSMLVFRTLLHPQRLYRMQSLCLLAGVLVPWAATAACQFGLIAPAASLYLEAAILALSGFALALALFRYRLLDLSPVAYDLLIENTCDGMIVLDMRKRILDINPSAERIIGYAASQVLGRSFRDIMSSRLGLASGKRGPTGTFPGRPENQGRDRSEIKLGEGEDARYYDVTLSALYGPGGRQTGHLVILHETTERRLVVERLDRMARYDPLTGLPNRSFFYEKLSQEILRNRNLLAVLFLDLDRFKIINDTLGHEVGDLLLKEAASRLRPTLREYDFAARLAGDEFTVILPEISDVSDVALIADQIIKRFAEPFEIAGHELLVTASVGACICPIHGKDPSTLVKNADIAMYQAKAAGKNRYALLEEAPLGYHTRHLEFEVELARAIENDELRLFYQPEIETDTGQVIGVEAVLRWEHPERGLLNPKDFLPLAEETGLISYIEWWVLHEACRQMRFWQEWNPANSPLTLSVNLFSRHLSHPDLMGEISCILEETGLLPESLVLGLKAEALDEDAPLTTATLQALKKLGVGLAVEGFGAGRTSLVGLKRLPLDVLKLDGSLTSGIERVDQNAEMISAVISLGHSLGLRVVAKRVENVQQLVRLRDMGCDAVQGKHFSELLSRQEASAFLVFGPYDRL